MKMRGNSPVGRRIAGPLLGALMAAGALVAGLMPGAVSAADPTLTLTFTGEYVTQSCSISGPADHDVTLPKVSTTALDGPGKTAGSTVFTIKAACEGGVANLRVYFSSPMQAANGNLNPEDVAGKKKAGNVQVQLLNADGSAITVGDRAKAGVIPVTSTAPMAIPFAAQYFATGATTAGLVKTSATYVLEVL